MGIRPFSDAFHQGFELGAGSRVVGRRTQGIGARTLLQPGIDELYEKVRLKSGSGVEPRKFRFKAPYLLKDDSFRPLQRRQEEKGQGFIDDVALMGALLG